MVLRKSFKHFLLEIVKMEQQNQKAMAKLCLMCLEQLVNDFVVFNNSPVDYNLSGLC